MLDYFIYYKSYCCNSSYNYKCMGVIKVRSTLNTPAAFFSLPNTPITLFIVLTTLPSTVNVLATPAIDTIITAIAFFTGLGNLLNEFISSITLLDTFLNIGINLLFNMGTN